MAPRVVWRYLLHLLFHEARFTITVTPGGGEGGGARSTLANETSPSAEVLWMTGK